MPLEKMSYIDNGTVRVGVDLNMGGSITYVADSKTQENIINNYDFGRQIQQCYYSGPKSPCHPSWKAGKGFWSWNPIQTGDCCLNPSKVIEFKNDGKEIYVKCIPLQWAMDNVPGECTYENWITLEGNQVHVRNRFVNSRTDKTFYEAHSQELPSVYTIGKLHRLFTYVGEKPFTGDKLTQIVTTSKKAGQWPWERWTATENWAAHVNNDGWGLGIYKPGTYQFVGGFSRTCADLWNGDIERNPDSAIGVGGPKDDPTGYITATLREHIDHNIVYEYSYTLILGDLDNIRKYVYDHKPEDTRPRYIFSKGRSNWTYLDATDAGYQTDGQLQIQLKGEHSQLISPETWWDAETMPRLYIRGAFKTGEETARLYWSLPGARTSENNPVFAKEDCIDFPVISDGQMRVYTVDLASAPNYKGIITGLRIDPVSSGKKGGYIKVKFISYRNEMKTDDIF